LAEQTYRTIDPPDIFIISGTHGSVEHIDPSNDTSVTLASASSLIRIGGFGISNASYTWLVGGGSDAIERLDHSTYTNAVSDQGQSAYIQSHGSSFSVGEYGYLLGDSQTNTVSEFDDSTEILSNIGSSPVRSIASHGYTDGLNLWGFGGTDTTGSILSHTQKMDVSTYIWSLLGTLYIIDGRTRHGSTGRGGDAYVAGGVDNDGLAMTIHKIDVSVDTANSGSRSYLSLARQDLQGINTPLKSWWVAGLNLSVSSVVDRTDFYTDTTDASYRCDLITARQYPIVSGDRTTLINSIGLDDLVVYASAIISESSPDLNCLISYRCGSSELILSNILYLGGGQNYASIYGDIIKVDLNTDFETIINGSLTPRYGLTSFSTLGNTWFIGGFDSNHVETGINERLDHASDTSSVVTSTGTSAFAYAGSAYSDSDGYIKWASNMASFDLSTETWTALAGSGQEIFIAGSGLNGRGVFAGGVDNGTPTNRIDVLDMDTEVLISPSSNLSSPKFAASSTSVHDTSLILGGTKISQIAEIESVYHLSDHSQVEWRGVLSTARSRTVAFSNSEYSWVFCGYRSAALSEVDKFDGTSGTVETTPRLSTATRHSLATGAPVDYGVMNGHIIHCALTTAAVSDVVIGIHGLRGVSDTSVQIKQPALTVHTDTSIGLVFEPVEYSNSIPCSLDCADPYFNDRPVKIALRTWIELNSLVVAMDPMTDRSVYTLSSNTSVHLSSANPDSVWIGGGLNVASIERMDASTLVAYTRGTTFLPRMGSATVTSSDMAWIAGGHDIQNIVELLIYDTDTVVTGDRTDLSQNRSYMASANNSTYGWYWGGASPNGLVGTLDRLDKSNDTAAALYRSDDWPRNRFDAEFLYGDAYGFGGQVGVQDRNWIRSFNPTSDTGFVTRTSLPLGMSNTTTCPGIDDASIIIFNKSNMYTYSDTTGVEVVISDLPNLDQYRSHTLGGQDLISGGTNASFINTDRIGIVDQYTSVHTNLPGLNYNRHNHWMAGRSTVADVASINIKSYLPAIGTENSTTIASSIGASAGSSLLSRLLVGERLYGSVDCICTAALSCSYTSAFESSWFQAADGSVWRSEHNSSHPVEVAAATPSSRAAGLSTGQTGYMLGGSASKIETLNYADETTTIRPGDTDQLCESAIPISSVEKHFLVGGCQYSDSSSYGLPITNKVRSWDITTYILTVGTTSTVRNITRAAASRIINGIGYILGGSINSIHSPTDEIELIDSSTDILSSSVSLLPTVTDLHQAITRSDDNIVTSNGVFIDTTTGSVSQLSNWPIRFGESMTTQSSNGLLIGGCSDRIEDPVVHGQVYGAQPTKTIYTYDAFTDILTAGVDLVPIFFDVSSMYPYSYCSPLSSLISDRSAMVSAAQGSYRTWLTAEVIRDYTFTDRPSLLHEVYDSGYSELICLLSSYGTEKIDALAICADTIATAIPVNIHHSVEHHYTDRSIHTPAVDTGSSDLTCYIVYDQLKTDLNIIVTRPSWNTYGSARMCQLYIGGHVTSRRCYIPAIFSANWDLFAGEGLATLLSGEIGSGDLVEIWNKLVRSGETTIDSDRILDLINGRFGNSDFIYSIDRNMGVAANEGVLIVPGSGIQIIRLVIRLSGTDMWVSNSGDQRFFLTCAESYEIDGIRNVPITSNMMLVTIKLTEPLKGETSFKFESARSSCHLRLIGM